MPIIDTRNFGDQLVNAVSKFSDNLLTLQKQQHGQVASAMRTQDIKRLVAQCPYAADLARRALSLETQGRQLIAKSRLPSSAATEIQNGAPAVIATQRAELENQGNAQIVAAKAIMREVEQLAQWPISVCLQKDSSLPGNTAQPVMVEESFFERYQWPIVFGLGAIGLGAVMYLRR